MNSFADAQTSYLAKLYPCVCYMFNPSIKKTSDPNSSGIDKTTGVNMTVLFNKPLHVAS